METIKRALEETLMDVALDVAQTLKTLVFTTEKGMQTVDLVIAKVTEVLQQTKNMEHDIDLEKMLEEALAHE
jgi:hypothetical protein